MQAHLARPAHIALWRRSLQHVPRTCVHTHSYSNQILPGTYKIHRMASTTAADQPTTDAPNDPVVQYVVVRRDLWTEVGWPLGPVIAQACHAAVAAIAQDLEDPLTKAYTSAASVDSMHKVVLEVKSEQQLKNLSSKLTEAGVRHKLWVEQPENYPTCLATKPYHRSSVSAHFKKLQLCKAAIGAQ